MEASFFLRTGLIFYHTTRHHNPDNVTANWYSTEGKSILLKQPMEVLFYPTPPDFLKSTTCWKVPKICPFDLATTRTCRRIRKVVEWHWEEKTDVLGENPAPVRVHHTSHMEWPGIETGPPWWQAGDLPHGHGTAFKDDNWPKHQSVSAENTPYRLQKSVS